jgi:hypothetical protein
MRPARTYERGEAVQFSSGAEARQWLLADEEDETERDSD